MPFSGWPDLDPAFAGNLQALIAAGPGITPFSGYRTIQRQTELWNAALKKYGSPAAARKWVAPPGSSQHNKRMAVDLKYADDAARQFAHANAAKYGLTFPMGHEPWHIEPIGARSGGDSKNTMSITANGAKAVINPTLLSGQPLADMEPKITSSGAQADITPVPIKEWGPNGPVITIKTEDKDKKRPLGKASEALAAAAEEMAKGKDASWAWVQEAMRPRPAGGPPYWVGRPIW